MENLLDVYMYQADKSVLELALPAWHGAIILAEQFDIEIIQKSVAHTILGHDYVSYRETLKTLNLESLKDRRDRLCLYFGGIKILPDLPRI